MKFSQISSKFFFFFQQKKAFQLPEDFSRLRHYCCQGLKPTSSVALWAILDSVTLATFLPATTEKLCPKIGHSHFFCISVDEMHK